MHAKYAAVSSTSNYNYVHNYYITVTSAPLLKDLCQHITPQYATCWKEIGTQLGISAAALNIIENDNMNKAVKCCNSMLNKWLEVDKTASWKKLIEIIESPAISCASANGM